MGRPQQDVIETFMSVTGASEAVALQKLEEHGGDLSAALNAHFSEGERVNSRPTEAPASHDDIMDIDEPINVETVGRPFPVLLASGSLNPFSLLDEHIGRTSFGRRGGVDVRSRAPRISHPREVREIPIEFKGDNNHSGPSSHGPNIEFLTENDTMVGPETFGHVTVDEEDEDLPVALNASVPGQTEERYDHPRGTVLEPSAPQVGMVADNNDIEEEMIKAAIEASKRDTQGYSSLEFDAPNVPYSGQLPERHHSLEDPELALAVSLSLKTGEQERTPHEKSVLIDQMGHASSSSIVELDEKTKPTFSRRQEPGTSSSGTRQFLSEGNRSHEDELEEIDEQPLVRRNSRNIASEAGNSSKEAIQLDDSPPSSPQTRDVGTYPQNNREADEWGGITSEEHDEAVMLEAAMFGGIPERNTYKFSYPDHQEVQVGPGRHTGFYPWTHRPPSPTLAAQRMLREQQDDEYLAALQADREKELKAMQEAELRHLEETAAREAALQKEKYQEEEIRKKKLEEEEFERALTAKLASLPVEPSTDDENAVTLLVRMPDGSRHGRRFLKSDKLQSLFDFIDTGRVAKPRTYKLVRPYPRRAFGEEESGLSFSDLGLTSKQEALFLELI
ncbi:unnamed protein product [Spirodela intermedia]|uniref:UBX domain-containing protein n=1 Tax=Spirodela intermedia TaxID=51605 RepID=A0A7I8IEU6_SPIIN|nr:unnamed protein product [Spirodela intermedia]CAA6656317.1 unnamed protein product [Spirodela intermedia]